MAGAHLRGAGVKNEATLLLKLLNPGPVTLTPRVRAALGRPDLCHREPEFAALQNEIRQRLVHVYADARSSHSAVLLTGSGTAAVEAMVGSLVPRGGRAIVVENGLYGERMMAMLGAQGKSAVPVRGPFSEPIDLASVERLLATERGITHVLAVHHETTTGRLNDIAALGKLCRAYGVPLLLDAVSSFGGEALELDAWNLEAVAGVANKCLHGAPGIGFVLVRKEVLESRASGATSVYLDLHRHHSEQERGSTAFTQAVPACQALDEALRELEESGGWRARHAHYRRLAERLFHGLRALGVRPLLSIEEPSSAVLTAYRLPSGCDYPSLHAALKHAGFVIYSGQGALAAEIFRVAVMGDLVLADVERLLAAFADALRGGRAPLERAGRTSEAVA